MTPPRLKSAMSPRATDLSLSSLEGKVVISAYERVRLAVFEALTNS